MSKLKEKPHRANSLAVVRLPIDIAAPEAHPRALSIGYAICCLLACSIVGSLSACGGSDGNANNGADGNATTGAQSSTAATASSESIPPAAAAVGYRTQTFGPEVTLGSNWFGMNFFRPANPAAQNSDGSVSMTNAEISSATRDPSMPYQWRGLAFGGGAYFEAVLYFSNADDSVLASWPAFWAGDIENFSQNAVTELTQWAGQPQGFGNWIETDFFEFDQQNVNRYGIQINNWYGYHDPAQVQAVRAYSQSFGVREGFNWSDPHKYGYLWVPATATSKGYAMTFMDDVQISATIYWDQYDPEAPPPPQVGTTAFSVLDSRHLILIVGTGSHNPMTVETVTVWQASDAENLSQ
jgi:hypothetical protein